MQQVWIDSILKTETFSVVRRFKGMSTKTDYTAAYKKN